MPYLFRDWGTASRARWSALSSRHIVWIALPECGLCVVSLLMMAVAVSVYDAIRLSLPEERTPSATSALAPISESRRSCGFADRLAYVAFRAFSRSVSLPELFRRVFSLCVIAFSRGRHCSACVGVNMFSPAVYALRRLSALAQRCVRRDGVAPVARRWLRNGFERVVSLAFVGSSSALFARSASWAS